MSWRQEQGKGKVCSRKMAGKTGHVQLHLEGLAVQSKESEFCSKFNKEALGIFTQFTYSLSSQIGMTSTLSLVAVKKSQIINLK